VAVGSSARFELLDGVPGDGHVLRLYPDQWRSIADEFPASLNRRSLMCFTRIPASDHFPMR
jgi:hypothetical protein